MNTAWSFPLLTIRGIALRVHVTFFIVLLLGAWQWIGAGPLGWAFGAGLMLLLFGCVALHELGHSLTALRYGIHTRQILLTPLGGIAVLSRPTRTPREEAMVTLAGPLVNVAIAAILMLALRIDLHLSGIAETFAKTQSHHPSMFQAMFWLFQANVALVLFNLIPAFPLDGGRLLRALLGTRMDWLRATRTAAILGQAIAIGFAALAILFGQVLLGIIAVFVFMGAGAENSEEHSRHVLDTLRVGDAYNRNAITLSEHDRLSRVAELILTSYQTDFAVVRSTEILGIVGRADVLHSLSRDMHDPSVFEVMDRHVVRVDWRLSLEKARSRMIDTRKRVCAVTDGHLFLGLVSLEDIAEAMTILEFRQKQQAARAAAGLTDDLT